MLASAIRRLGLLTTLGLAIWLIGKFRADQRAAISTPWPQVPTDEPAPEPASETVAASEEVAPMPKARAQSVALRRPGQVISLPVPVAEQLPLTAATPEPERTPAAGQAWVEPVEGACPPGYPVKAKLRSHLYHEPGMLAYKRTHPDRCYADGAAAERDGFVKAKR